MVGFQRRGTTRTTNEVETPEQRAAKQRFQAWQRSLGETPSQHNLLAIQRLWEGALEILNGDDRDLHQRLAEALDDRRYNGTENIDVIIDMRAKESIQKSFISACRPFLQTMTHPNFVDCLTTKDHVDSLYAWMSYGMIIFFQRLCEIILRQLGDEHFLDSNFIQELATTAVAMIAALEELIGRDHKVRSHEDLLTLVEFLGNLGRSFAARRSLFAGQVLIQRAKYLEAVVERTNGLAAEVLNAVASSSVHSDSTTACANRNTIPNDRHDNDKIDITEMSIFPTLDEVLSNTKDYLPSTHPEAENCWDSKIQRHLDTHFRLLRHDIMAHLKSRLTQTINHLTTKSLRVHPHRGASDIFTYAVIEKVLFDGRIGLHMQISIPYPSDIANLSAIEQSYWLEQLSRLADGMLLAFVWKEEDQVRFILLACINQEAGKGKTVMYDCGQVINRFAARLITQDPSTVSELIDLSCFNRHGVLLEFPNIIPATFIPVLENLQNMHLLSRLPFNQWITPDRSAKRYMDIPPPLYARKPGFAFSLKSILLQEDVDPPKIDINASSDNREFLTDVSVKTGLDRVQCHALVSALTREYAFIQGPPGTGKSYLGIKLMKILLDAKSEADLGPIIVVCYTNHALDQFLEQLISSGVDKVVRIGGGSRSQILANYNIRMAAQKETRTSLEGKQLKAAHKTFDDYVPHLKDVLSDLNSFFDNTNWRRLDCHVQSKHPCIHNQIASNTEEGWTMAGRRPFEVWIQNAIKQGSTNTPIPDAEELIAIVRKAASNIYDLDQWERYSLAKFWIAETYQHSKTTLCDVLSDATEKQQIIQNVHAEVRRQALQKADVIGMTTAGLAKNISTLQRIRCKVIICEEAAEVTEAHMLSAMLPTVQHCIQIGDHQQLRPSINNFKLSIESDHGSKYQLDRSQFERLCVGEPGWPRMRVAQLKVQRRMRPQISELIRKTLYPKMIDDRSTTQHEDAVGMRNNLFWFDHPNFEDQQYADTNRTFSKSNDFEASMTCRLVLHLLYQGTYTSNDIAVLTPYTAQLQSLRGLLSEHFKVSLSGRDQEVMRRGGFGTAVENEGSDADTNVDTNATGVTSMTDFLRLATVDNFQGEEAKVVIVSLVRNNVDNNVGFLRTENRINVLLSRARNGLYLIGNARTYSTVPMWQTVISMLRSEGAIAYSLPLCCPRHPKKTIAVSEPDDFDRYSPQGGCQERCYKELQGCGHICQSACHSDKMHDIWKCQLPCERVFAPCNHPCQQPTCGDDCGKCMVPLSDVLLRCGHSFHDVPCWQAHDKSTMKCPIIVRRWVPGCGHSVDVACSVNVNDPEFRCPQECSAMLRCGHSCSGSCGRCKTEDSDGYIDIEHVSCEEACGKWLRCGQHTCQLLCGHGATHCHEGCQPMCGVVRIGP